MQYWANYDTPIHFVTRNPKSGSIRNIDGLLKHPDYSINHRYPDLIIFKLKKPMIVNIEGSKQGNIYYPGSKFSPSAYYNQFFNEKLKPEEIKRKQYYPQDEKGKKMLISMENANT